jgi:hypothetical protein
VGRILTVITYFWIIHQILPFFLLHKKTKNNNNNNNNKKIDILAKANWEDSKYTKNQVAILDGIGGLIVPHCTQN